MRGKRATLNWEETPSDDPRNAPTQIKIGETANKKGVQIKRDKEGYWSVSFTSGGELPLKLQGKYLLEKDAAYAAESYLLNG